MVTLITYGDDNFVNSLWLIRRQARRIRQIDKVVVYTPADLPTHVRSLPVMDYRRGGGFMVWKPYIINHALSQVDNGDIVIFVDAGCRMRPVEEWQRWLDTMQDHDAAFFVYRDDYDYGWQKWGHNSVKIKHWSKPAAIEYFRGYFDDDSFLEQASAWSGCFIVKKTDNITPVIRDWKDIALTQPNLFADPLGAERLHLPYSYCAHRHDQTILSFLISYYRDKSNIAILPETAESDKDNAAVAAVRYRVGKMSWWDTLKFRIHHLLHTND